MEKQHYKNIGVVLLVLFSVAYFTKSKYIFFNTLAFGILMFTFEKAAVLFSDYWMRLAKLLGDINAKVILTIMFISILTPIAFFKKMFGAKNNKLSGTNWQNVEVDEKTNFKNPW